jgi:hypothetical protein
LPPTWKWVRIDFPSRCTDFLRKYKGSRTDLRVNRPDPSSVSRLFGLLTRRIFEAFGRADQETLLSFALLASPAAPATDPSRTRLRLSSCNSASIPPLDHHQPASGRWLAPDDRRSNPPCGLYANAIRDPSSTMLSGSTCRSTARGEPVRGCRRGPRWLKIPRSLAASRVLRTPDHDELAAEARVHFQLDFLT